MPFVRSLASIYYILLAASISLNGEIISPYSYCTKKGLVYITIIAPFSYQPSSYFECTKPTLVHCATCAWYLLTNIYSNFVGTISIFLARPNC